MESNTPAQPEQIPYTAPAERLQQIGAVPYTVPVDAAPQYQQPQQYAQYPQYTVPLGGTTQQSPQYTVPLDTAPSMNTSQEPVTVYTPSPPPTPGYTVPVPEVPQFEVPNREPSQKKRVRKMPILLAAIAVLLVVVLVATHKDKDPKPTGTNTAAPIEVEELGPVRIENGAFTFDAETFVSYFQWSEERVAEGHVAVFGDESVLDSDDGSNTYVYTIINGDLAGLREWGRIFVFTKPETKNVEQLMLLLDEQAKKEDGLPILIEDLIKQCHGAMTAQMLQQFYASEHREERLDKDGNPYDHLRYAAHGLELQISVSDGGMTVMINPEGFTQAQKRYDSQGFLFTPEEFSGIYLDTLAQENIPFTLGEMRQKVEHNFGYPILYQGKEVGLLVASKSQGAEKCSGVSVTYDIQDDDTIDEYGMAACVSLFPACLGVVTDAQWQYINDMEPSYQDEGVINYYYELEGLTVMMNIWADRVHLDIYI